MDEDLLHSSSYFNCVCVFFFTLNIILTIPFCTCTNDFYARFNNFLIFLKFSYGTFYRDNLAVHLFKYVSCIMFICIYVFE